MDTRCYCRKLIHTWACTIRTIFTDYIPGRNNYGSPWMT